MAQAPTTRAVTSRLPSTRESRPALIGLAILLIIGGALASAWLALQAGHRASFVQVDANVAQGARITADDLKRVSLPEDFDGGIAWADSSDLVGQSATVRLLPGTILTPDMVSKKSGIADNQTQLTIPVDSSPFIRGLQPGAQLALDIGSGSGGSGGGRPILAELVSVGKADDGGGLGGVSSGTLNIVVSIDISCLSTVSQGIADQAVTPALVGGTKGGVVAATCGG
ncbi:SAF domain-containing protein [Nocardioides sp. DS6]|uniref:SAF domain-containing protein n=1 Tax=Nocardioides eburneus TaxID=3231482 RepID=A0ABV3T307_9ACTN